MYPKMMNANLSVIGPLLTGDACTNQMFSVTIPCNNSYHDRIFVVI